MGSGMTNDAQDDLPDICHYSGIKGKPGPSRGLWGPVCGSTGPEHEGDSLPACG